jgi:sugar-phosphatase
MRCEAVLFDLDGVLVDSTPAVVSSWRGWAEAQGLDAEPIIEFAHGRKAHETVRLFAPELDENEEVRRLERAELDNLGGVLEVRGARQLLDSLPSGAWTVVTSSTRVLATSKMEHLGLRLPKQFVTADDVEQGKPHPEPYLRGAEILAVAPQACVVVEDAPAGVQAAKAAGMRVIAVATTYRPEDLSGADVVTDSVASISASFLPGDGGRVELVME